MSNQKVLLEVELTESQALALAQFFKRAGLSDYRDKAVNEEEAYQMQEGGLELQKGLVKLGFDPR